MHAEIFILQICEFLEDGDGYYRLHEPSRQLSRLPGVVVADCHYYHRRLPELMELADVLILPFVHNWDFFPMLGRRRSAGRVTVFEANDNFYDVQPWSPIAAQWQDRSIQDEYRLFMGQADAVQTSTPELARLWQPWSRRVAVFKNQLVIIPPLRPPPNRPLTIGWAGSPGHFADWFHVSAPLGRWLAAHPQVHLAVMTNEFARPFFQLPAERYHLTPFGSLQSYLQFLPSLDIGLAPMLPSGYNRCRSDVKFLEYAANGVPGIYADIEPYRDSVVHGQTGLIYRTTEELLQHLDTLANDPALRQRIRENAHNYVSTQRRMEQHIAERLTFYQELLAHPPRAVELSPEILGEAKREGNYLQFLPGAPEKALVEAIRGAASQESVRQLDQLVRQFPTYASAFYHLGRQLNDLQDYRNGLARLETARTLQPTSAAVLAEMGRAHFVLKDYSTARSHLEESLKLNPNYLPGWQYLLRMLTLTRAADGKVWAQKAHQAFPRNLLLALAGVPLFPPLERVPELERLLALYAHTLTPEERPAATAAFSAAIIQSLVGQPIQAIIVVLERACETFPESAKLANQLGSALHAAGRDEDSRRHYRARCSFGAALAHFSKNFPSWTVQSITGSLPITSSGGRRPVIPSVLASPSPRIAIRGLTLPALSTGRHEVFQRRLRRRPGTRPDQEEHRLPGPTLCGMARQEAGSLARGQRRLSSSKHKGIGTCSKLHRGFGSAAMLVKTQQLIS